MSYIKHLTCILETKAKYVGERNGLQVYLVDGEEVRNSSQDAEEFGAWATHGWFPQLIPKGQLWVDDRLSGELEFFVAAALAELKAKQAGKSESAAYDHAIRVERMLRQKAANAEYGAIKHSQKAMPQVYLGLYTTILETDHKVYWVDGDFIRSPKGYKTDFIEGGNGAVYDFCPDDELWIERAVKNEEAPAIVVHEFTEFTVMTERDKAYNTAHGLAARVEFGLRGRIRKEHLPNLTKAWALRQVDNL